MTLESVEPAQLRIGDAERQLVAEQLSRHCAAGRLGVEELDERIGRAWSARTEGDLRGLTADLPSLANPTPEAPTLTSWLEDGRVLLLTVPTRVLLIGAGTGLFLLLAFVALLLGHGDFGHGPGHDAGH